MNTEFPGYIKRWYTHTPGIVRKPYRSHIISGKGYEDLTELPDVPVRVSMSYKTSRSSGHCGTGVQNSQKFRAGSKRAVPVPRVLWPRAYRTSRSSGYRYECRTELPEVPGTGMNALQNLQKFFVG